MAKYHEQVVVKQNQQSQNLLYNITRLLLIVWALAGFLALIVMDWFFVILSIGLFVGCFLLKDSFIIEYEYCFLDDEIHFARVMNGKKRKELMTIRTSEIEAYGSIKSEAYRQYKLNSNIKKVNYTLNPENHFFVFLRNKHQLIIVLFEPDDVLLDCLKFACPMLQRQ